MLKTAAALSLDGLVDYLQESITCYLSAIALHCLIGSFLIGFVGYGLTYTCSSHVVVIRHNLMLSHVRHFELPELLQAMERHHAFSICDLRYNHPETKILTLHKDVVYYTQLSHAISRAGQAFPDSAQPSSSEI